MRAWANDAFGKQYSQESYTVQVKGSAKRVVTVVATQQLEAGDELWRFEAEAAKDEPHGGSNNNRYIYTHTHTYIYIYVERE